MMNMEETRLSNFAQAITALPIRLQREALALPPEIRCACEELRLRAGKPMAYSRTGMETAFGKGPISADDLQETLGRATRYSVHSYGESLQNGFVTLEGGHRLGLCGTAVLREGRYPVCAPCPRSICGSRPRCPVRRMRCCRPFCGMAVR